MLMSLEKDRLIAKVNSLGISLKQIGEDSGDNLSVDQRAASETKRSKQEKTSQMQAVANTTKMSAAALAKTGMPSEIPQRERYNPDVNETYEPIGAHMSMIKTFKGHMAGVTSLAYNPKKDIVATGSDDSTWKLWSIPNGDLIMSGEGHVDWVGGVDFHPRGNLLATASGDGTVKVWDFVNACCA
jgi:sperm-associated antigen 16 protein